MRKSKQTEGIDGRVRSLSRRYGVWALSTAGAALSFGALMSSIQYWTIQRETHSTEETQDQYLKPMDPVQVETEQAIKRVYPPKTEEEARIALLSLTDYLEQNAVITPGDDGNVFRINESDPSVTSFLDATGDRYKFVYLSPEYRVPLRSVVRDNEINIGPAKTTIVLDTETRQWKLMDIDGVIISNGLPEASYK